jgi:hypothetical protein
MRTSALRASWLLEAESIDFRGRIVSTATSANPSDYTMVFKATNPAGTGVRMAGTLSVAGSVQVISPNDVGVRWHGRHSKPGRIRVGISRAGQHPLWHGDREAGRRLRESRSRGVARRSICVPTPAAGSKSRQGPELFARNANSVVELTAGGDITVIGTVVGGGTIGSNGATTGRATTPK